jgi:hypothetical protein
MKEAMGVSDGGGVGAGFRGIGAHVQQEKGLALWELG